MRWRLKEVHVDGYSPIVLAVFEHDDIVRNLRFDCGKRIFIDALPEWFDESTMINRVLTMVREARP